MKMKQEITEETEKRPYLCCLCFLLFQKGSHQIVVVRGG